MINSCIDRNVKKCFFPLKYGGIYLDSDVISLHRYLDPYPNAVVREEFNLSNALLKFIKGHPAIPRACQRIVGVCS